MVNISKIKCEKCGTLLLEDENANYSHWRYYCQKCEMFKVIRSDE